MTLTDLYNMIDWTDLDALHTEKPPSEDWKKRFRCALLDEGLHSEDREKMMAARTLLKPVWHQVVGHMTHS